MKHLKYLIPLAALAGLGPHAALAQGRLGLLPQGEYVCALPGDASGAAWIEQESRNFSVTGASSYRTGSGGGTYLLEGKQVIFTRGPLRNKKLMLLNSGLLQEIGRDGKLGRLRCHRAGPLND